MQLYRTTFHCYIRFMKVVHITKNLGGGAAQAALRLHQGLLNIGVDSNFLVHHHDGIESIPKGFSIEQFYSKSRFQLIQKLNIVYNKRHVKFSRDIFYNPPFSLWRIENLNILKNADVINLHWVPKVINYKTFFKKLENKRIIWTMHDMNPFTGGYHYRTDFPLYDLRDMVADHELQKQNFLTSKPDVIVGPSKWLMNEAKNSVSFANKKIVNIPYNINFDIFKPGDKSALRKKYNLPINKKIVIFVAENPADNRKGLSYLLKAIELINNPDVFYLVIGKKGRAGNLKNIKEVGFVKEEAVIAELYALSDIFVIPSLEDNLPNTVIEALSCGCVSIGFNIGGIPDMIKDNRNGFIANVISAESLAQSLQKATNLSLNDMQNMSQNAITFALDHFSEHIVVDQYLNIYK